MACMGEGIPRVNKAWKGTTGNDRRLSAAGDVRIRSIADLKTPRATLTQDLYQDGAEILHCVGGRFRLTLDGSRAIAIGSGEVLVIYPDHRVTLEALARENRLVSGMLCGGSVGAYLDSLGYFDGIHGPAVLQRKLLAQVRGMLRRQTEGDMTQKRRNLSLLTDILTSVAKDLNTYRNAFLGEAIHRIQANLAKGVVRLEPLCDQLHVSRAHLHAAFVEAGLGSPSAFIRDEQKRLVMRLLLATRLPVAEVARRAGFISMTHFSNFMRRYTGKFAREWRA